MHVLCVFAFPDQKSLPPSPVVKKTRLTYEAVVVTLAKEWNRYIFRR